MGLWVRLTGLPEANIVAGRGTTANGLFKG
jgi:hypothetical protein